MNKQNNSENEKKLKHHLEMVRIQTEFIEWYFNDKENLTEAYLANLMYDLKKATKILLGGM